MSNCKCLYLCNCFTFDQLYMYVYVLMHLSNHINIIVGSTSGS